MPTPLRQSKKYFLSVEGETEKWYFEHLCRLVNTSDRAQYKLSMKCDVEKDPLGMAKRLVVPKRTTIDVWHVFDFESESEEHQQSFREALRQMRDANRLGKKLRYHSAYSNFYLRSLDGPAPAGRCSLWPQEGVRPTDQRCLRDQLPEDGRLQEGG